MPMSYPASRMSKELTVGRLAKMAYLEMLVATQAALVCQRRARGTCCRHIQTIRQICLRKSCEICRGDNNGQLNGNVPRSL
jgi:hypothetical protein